VLVRIALVAGSRDTAEQVVACSRYLAAINPGSAPLVAAAAHTRGLLDRDAGALVAAADGHRHPLAGAAAAEDAGSVLAGQGAGARATAREQLGRALAVFEEAGAEHDAGRVRARLRDLGLRPCHWSRADRPVEGWASLTSTEHRVALIVAEGLTNAEVAARLFISRHTVDSHLRQIFRKLGIRSRVELTRMAVVHDAAEVAAEDRVST
jgi:DNA-binding CsgD family transcriptional regulator